MDNQVSQRVCTDNQCRSRVVYKLRSFPMQLVRFNRGQHRQLDAQLATRMPVSATASSVSAYRLLDAQLGVQNTSQIYKYRRPARPFRLRLIIAMGRGSLDSGVGKVRSRHAAATPISRMINDSINRSEALSTRLQVVLSFASGQLGVVFPSLEYDGSNSMMQHMGIH